MPDSEKHQVEIEYGMAPKGYGRTIEIDHIVSLELGGSNDIANLYPEPGSGPASYHVKDKLENKLHDLVCAGTHHPPRGSGRDRIELGGAVPAHLRSHAVKSALGSRPPRRSLGPNGESESPFPENRHGDVGGGQEWLEVHSAYIGGAVGFAFAAVWATAGLGSALICMVAAVIGYAAVRLSEGRAARVRSRPVAMPSASFRAGAANPRLSAGPTNARRSRKPSAARAAQQVRPQKRVPARAIVDPEPATYGW